MTIVDGWIPRTVPLDVVFVVFGVIVLLIFLISILQFTGGLKSVPNGLELPPGPSGKFFVGNSADRPTHHDWETYTRWAKEYGDLVHIKVYGTSMVFVNTMDIAHELFDKRSSLYSDRFEFTMINELMGFNWALTRMKYGPRWRRHRRAFYQYFHPKASATYQDIQTKHTLEMVQNMHRSPNSFISHLRQLAGAVILEVVYGIDVLPTDDPYINLAEKVVSYATEAGNAGTFLVDIIPILKYVPHWVPGAGFQKKARVWKKNIEAMVELPFREVKQALASGAARPSYTSSLLEGLANVEDAENDQEEIIRNTGAIAYGAGADTTVSAMTSFVLAMVMYPEVQRKAQMEIDLVVGVGQLPTFEDRENLPYINALCKEVLRWHPVLPLAIAHRVTQDDVYGKYFIPGGSLVFGNAWAILQDEKTYGSHPEQFRPERFLNPEVPDPTVAFGFGRRICPGRSLANSSLFLAFAYILKVFDISRARDCAGIEIPVKHGFTSGMISHPEPFQCSIVPRSAAAESLIWGRTGD